MTEEQNGEDAAAGKGALAKKVMVPVGIGLVAIVAAVVIWLKVLAPMFEEPDESGTATPAADGDKIPVAAISVPFESQLAQVLTDDPSRSAVLQYSVSLVCSNQATADMIAVRNDLFTSILVGLHDSRTAEELRDPLAKEGLLRQARYEANAMLRRIQPDAAEENEVLMVVYTEYTVLNL